MSTNEYYGPAIIELMGHRTTGGIVSEVEVAGTKLLRVDTPAPDGTIAVTQYYGASAVYCLTPCDEVTLQKYLGRDRYDRPEPVRLALSAPARAHAPEEVDVEDEIG